MSIKYFAGALLLAFGFAISMSYASVETKGIPTFQDNKKEIEYFKVKYFKGAKRIVVPTVNLKLLVSGTASAAAQSGGNSARVKSKFVVSGIDKEFAQGLAKKIQDDTIARLRDVGWEVLSYEDIKADEPVVKEERLKIDPAWQMPVEKIGGSLYVVANPSDEQNFDSSRLGWNLRKVAKEREAVVYTPTFNFSAPQFWGEVSRGYKSKTASINSAPGVTLPARGAYVAFLNHKAAGGSIANNEMYVHVADDAGVLSEATDASPTFANALSKALATMGGGWINSKVGFYGYTLNREKFEAGVLGTVTNFNTVVAKETAKYLKK